MNDTQLYLAIGMPSIVALIGILVNVSYFVALNGRFNSMDGRFNSMEGRMNTLEGNINALGSRFDKRIDDLQKHLDAKIDNAFDHVKLLLEVHEAKHHHNN